MVSSISESIAIDFILKDTFAAIVFRYSYSVAIELLDFSKCCFIMNNYSYFEIFEDMILIFF